MDYRLGIHRGLEYRPVRLELVAKQLGVDEVAVMRRRNRPARILYDEGLGVTYIGIPSG